MLRYTVSGMIRGKLAELASAAKSTESCLSAAVWIGAQTFIWANWNGSTRARKTRKFEAELWLIYPNKVSLRRSATDSSPLKADGSWQLHPKSATFMVRHHYVMLFLIGKNFFLSTVKKKQRGGRAGSGARSWWPHVGFAVTTVKTRGRQVRPSFMACFVCVFWAVRGLLCQTNELGDGWSRSRAPSTELWPEVCASVTRCVGCQRCVFYLSMMEKTRGPCVAFSLLTKTKQTWMLGNIGNGAKPGGITV